jgi:phosphate acetyltransferase
MSLLERSGDIRTVAPVGPGEPPASKYDRLIARAQQLPRVATVVVHPCDESSLRGPVEAAAANIIRPILVGPA